MLSLIVTPEKLDGRTRLKKTLRDVREEDFASLLAEHGCDPSVAIARTSYTDERGNISVVAPIKCKVKTPKSMEFKVGSQKIRYRGPIIVTGADGADAGPLPGAFYKGNRAEITYKDDAICLPSMAEWETLPDKLGREIRSGNWIWMRDAAMDHYVWVIGKLDSGNPAGFSMVPGTTDCGGIAAFVNLNKLPEKTAAKIRAEVEKHGGTALIGQSRGVRFYRITDDVYAISAVQRNFEGMSSRWRPFFKDTAKEDCYDNSYIRRHLNEEYLPKLIDEIDA